MKQIKFSILLLVIFFCIYPTNSPGQLKEVRNERGDYEYNRRFEKVYDVAPQSLFSLRAEYGDVVVTTGDQKNISVVAEIRASAKKENYAQQFGEEVKIEVSQTPQELSIETIYPSQRRYRSGLFSSRIISFSVDYRIKLPAAMSADVRNEFGKLAITGVQGSLKAKTEHHGMTIIDCSNVSRLENQFGSIRIQNIGGKDIEIENTNSDIEASIVKANVNFYNRFGKVEVEQVDGDVMINNSNGSVTVAGVKGMATIDDQFGTIDLKNIAGKIKVNSGNGSLRIKDVAGGYLRNSFGTVRVLNSFDSKLGLTVDNQNGDIYVETMAGDASLSTSFARVDAIDVTGNVTVRASNSTIEISNPGGIIETDNSFGSVIVKGAKSDCNIRNRNGSIDLTTVRTGENYRLSTTFAPIKLTLPKDISATFTVETSFGDIECDFPLKVLKADTRMALEGKVKEGTSKIQIENQNGAVYIRKGAGEK
jgi:DUF4097 and DUF4098 domain-containing protein YvlB